MIDQYSEIKEATDEEIEKEVEEEEKEETPTAPLIKTGLFAILFIVGLTALIFGGLSIYDNVKIFRYKSVEATIGPNYSIVENDVRFLYTVDKKDYDNYMVVKKDLKEGDKINIFYDPKNPDDIVFKKSINFIGIILVIAGFFAMKFSLPRTIKNAKEAKTYFQEEESE